jgi:predicted enzyme related to lactoylglutathione lyase
VKFNGADLNVGIHPASDECRKNEKGFTITFHVDNYARYLSKLKSRGVTPFKTEDGGAFGTFAYFSDPENNTMAIWGK